nr:ankyrin repeat domain-containing protein [uncultured Flavobacterium sp.]
MKTLLLMSLVTIMSFCTNNNDYNMENKKLIEYVIKNNLTEVKRLIEKGENINTVNKEGKSILLLAVINNQTEMATFLTQQGADVNLQAKNSDTAFLFAGASGQTKMVKLFLEHGARFDIYNRYGGTALIPACERGHVETVKVLAQVKNFPINHVNNLGWTGLMEAVVLGDGSFKYQEIIKILLEHGADQNINDFDNISALQHAKNKGQTEIVTILSNHQKSTN